jgi:hypothetical protein
MEPRRPMILQNLRSAGAEQIVFDGSRPLFRVGQYPRVSEFLQALPMIKADPVGAAGPTADGGAFTMKLTVQRALTVPSATWYDNAIAGNIAEVTSGLSSTDYTIARVGAQFSVPRLDAQAAARNTALDPAEWRMYIAASAALKTLDTALARGAAAQSPANVVGLAALSTASGRTDVTSNNVDQDVRRALYEIRCSGMGAGEGATCLVTGPTGWRRLLASAVGASSAGMFKTDPRTGLNVFHYQGIPVYRTNVDESATTRLYAINLGGTGLNLVYTAGTPDTFGLACEEDPLAIGKATEGYVVHGAFGLVPWEVEAMFEITGINLNPV